MIGAEVRLGLRGKEMAMWWVDFVQIALLNTLQTRQSLAAPPVQ